LSDEVLINVATEAGIDVKHLHKPINTAIEVDQCIIADGTASFLVPVRKCI